MRRATSALRDDSQGTGWQGSTWLLVIKDRYAKFDRRTSNVKRRNGTKLCCCLLFRVSESGIYVP
jgi:hypothetical protein